MNISSFGFGYAGTLSLPFDEAMEKAKEALQHQGFGVQAEIPISTALKSKIGVDVPREVILGVCNPGLAHRAMQAEPNITVLLPCNVTVKETPEGTRIAVGDPQAMVNLSGHPELKAIAAEADSKLRQALAEL